MSNRADPKSGQNKDGNAPKRVRQMTVYDRLEDARHRRQALLASRAKVGPTASTPKSPSNTASAPTPPKAPEAPEVKAPQAKTPSVEAPENARTSELVSAPAATPGTRFPEIERPEEPALVAPMRKTSDKPDHTRKKRRGVGYWTGLFRAMAAIAALAVIFALIAQRNDTPSDPAAAASTALVQPDVSSVPIAAETPAPTPAVTPVATSLAIVQSDAPAVPTAPEPEPFDVIFAPLVSPDFPTPAPLETAQPLDAPPTELDQSIPYERLVPPTALQRVPPMRPDAFAAETDPAPAPDSAMADATNVVLMVPDFAPQSRAEAMVTTAASLGIPVDRTLRRVKSSFSPSHW